ncbi:MAG: transglutaminaseTgpA domain-containing protein, partial [Anaerolineaceae bacterium]
MYTQFMEAGQKRWWDIWAALLLLFVLWATALRLELTGWTVYLNRVQLLVTIAYALGIMLGASTFDRRVTRWMAAAYSMFFLPWQLATIIRDEPVWVLRIAEVWTRSVDSLNLFIANRPVTDVTLFVLVMSILFWFLGMTAGYMLTRYAKPWLPLCLTGFTLFVIDFNDPNLASLNHFTGLFVLLALLLLGRLYYLRSQHTWMEKGVAIEFETGFNFSRSMVISGFLLVLAAWNVPSFFAAFTPGTPANQVFTEQWNQFRERVSNAFAGLDSSIVYIYDFYQDSMPLGSGTQLGRQVFFTVRPSVIPSRFRFYWRGYSYDYFDGREWSNTVEGRGALQPDDWPLIYPPYDARRRIEMEFRMRNVGMRPLYAPAMILSIDQPVRVVTDDIGDGVTDLIGVIADPSIRPQGVFRAESLVAVPTIYQLREAGSDYPAWTERYLQLPEDFSPRVRELARQIVGDETNPYDQVQLITQFLRTEIEYQAVIEEPPIHVDLMEWFLFEYQKGFCNYYATAHVLMLRSLGIPARIAVGFAQGEFNEEDKHFEVREENSHAWPEVYFPGIGWVEFEPTAALPTQDWIEGSPSDLDDPSAVPPFDPDRPMLDTEAMHEGFGPDDFIPAPAGDIVIPQARNYAWIWVLSAMLIITLSGWLASRRYPQWFAEPLPIKLERSFLSLGVQPPGILQLWARQMELRPIERMFTHIPWMLTALGQSPESGTTPQEQVERLIKGIPDATAPASVLLDQYQLAV